MASCDKINELQTGQVYYTMFTAQTDIWVTYRGHRGRWLQDHALPRDSMLPRWARGPFTRAHRRHYCCCCCYHHHHIIPQVFTSFSCLSAASRKFGSMVPRRASIRALGSIARLREGFGCGRISDLYKSAAIRTWDARLSSYRRERKKAVTGPDRSAPKFPHTTSAQHTRHSGTCRFCLYKLVQEIPVLFPKSQISWLSLPVRTDSLISAPWPSVAVFFFLRNCTCS